MWTHVIFFIRKFFHLKGGWAGSPFVKREALSHPSFTSFSHPTLGFNNGCSGNNHRQQAPFRLTNEPCCKQWWINFWTLTPGRTQPTQQNLPRLSMQCDRAKRWELRQFLFPSCRFIKKKTWASPDANKHLMIGVKQRETVTRATYPYIMRCIICWYIVWFRPLPLLVGGMFICIHI